MSPTAAIRTTSSDGETVIPQLLRLQRPGSIAGGRRRPDHPAIDGQAACPENGIPFATENLRLPGRGAVLMRWIVNGRGCDESGFCPARRTEARGTRLLHADARIAERCRLPLPGRRRLRVRTIHGD